MKSAHSGRVPQRLSPRLKCPFENYRTAGGKALCVDGRTDYVFMSTDPIETRPWIKVHRLLPTHGCIVRKRALGHFRISHRVAVYLLHFDLPCRSLSCSEGNDNVTRPYSVRAF